MLYIFPDSWGFWEQRNIFKRNNVSLSNRNNNGLNNHNERDKMYIGFYMSWKIKWIR